MSIWRATKAKRVYAALLRIGWTFKKQAGSHGKLQRKGWANFTFCFHDSEEIGPATLSKISEDTGLRPEDLWPLVPRLGLLRTLARAAQHQRDNRFAFINEPRLTIAGIASIHHFA